MKKAAIILLKQIAGLTLKGMQISAFYIARYSPVVVAFLKATLKLLWHLTLLTLSTLYKLLIMLIEFLTPYFICAKNRIADFFRPYYIRINSKLGQWFQVFYSEMDEIALVEDDGNAFQTISSVASTEEKQSNFLFEENLLNLNEAVVARSQAASRWFLRTCELCNVFIDNTLRLVMGKKFTEVVFEVVLATPVNAMQPKQVRRVALHSGNPFHQPQSHRFYLNSTPVSEMVCIRINKLINSFKQLNINILKYFESGINRISFRSLRSYINMFLPIITTGHKANRSGYP